MKLTKAKNWVTSPTKTSSSYGFNTFTL